MTTVIAGVVVGLILAFFLAAWVAGVIILLVAPAAFTRIFFRKRS